MLSENQESQRNICFYEIKLTPSNLINAAGLYIRVHCSDNSISLDKISNKYYITS